MDAPVLPSLRSPYHPYTKGSFLNAMGLLQLASSSKHVILPSTFLPWYARDSPPGMPEIPPPP